MRVERVALILFLLLACLAPTARAGGEKEVKVGDDVTLRVRWPWPDMLTHGAQPLLVDLANSGTTTRRVSLLFTLNQGSQSVTITKSIELGGGERSSFEVCAPVSADGASTYYVNAHCNGESQYLPGAGAAQQPLHGTRNVLVLSAVPLDPGWLPTWGKALSGLAPETWTRDFSSSTGRQWVRDSSGSMVLVPATSTPPDAVRVNPVLFQDLPRQSESYASIDAVVLDTSAGLPGASELAALAGFARTGGIVVVSGTRAREHVRATPDFASWMEPRFYVGRAAGAETYLCGLGLLIVAPAVNPFDEQDFDAYLMESLQAQGGRLSCIPTLTGGRNQGEMLKLPGLELPYRALMLVLVVFALVIGPLNFWLVKRSKKPVLLLFTVPAIALVFSLALFAYGAVAQGLDVRARRATLTLLDQRVHRSTALEIRELFAGLSPGRALRPGPGAWLWFDPSGSSYSARKNYAIDLDDGVQFSGDYLPVRTPTRQTLITDRAARQRVDVRRAGDGYTAQFGLGADVQRFVFCDGDGRLWRSDERTADGGTARLVPSKSNDVDVSDISRILAANVADHVRGMPRGTYLAVLDSSPFTDMMGVVPRDVNSRHHLAGILDLEEVK
ncbi:MAG: hypothetical protein JNL28_11175 [Planctomycetes bacterium]|nr:hypothetical protein [Planctomycetota bacterium]